jgi:hypothetical protein
MNRKRTSISIIEAKEANVPKIVCRLSIRIDVADECEPRSPKIGSSSLLTVSGTIDDFRLSYPLSNGAELTINKLPLGTVERLKIEDNRKTLNIFAEASGEVFIPNAKQNLADITAGYEALKLKVTPVRRIVDRIRESAQTDTTEAIPVLEADRAHFTIRLYENLLKIDLKGSFKNEIEEALENKPVLKETIGSVLSVFVPLHIRLSDIDSVHMDETGKLEINLPLHRNIVIPLERKDAERFVDKLNELIPKVHAGKKSSLKRAR